MDSDRGGRKYPASKKLLSGSSPVGFAAEVRIGRVRVYWWGGGQFDDRDLFVQLLSSTGVWARLHQEW
jgi:hypothetical protein